MQPRNPHDGLSYLASTGQDDSPVERLVRLASLERSDMFVVVAYSLGIGVVSLAVPVAAQTLVNTVAFTALLQPIVVLTVLVLVGLVFGGVLRALQYLVVETLQRRFFVRFADESIVRLTRADLKSIDDHPPQELARYFLEVAVVQKSASTLLLEGLSVLLQGVVSLVLLAFYHPALLAFDLVLIGAMAFIFWGLGRNGIVTAIAESKAKYAMAGWLDEVASASRAFKAPRTVRFALERTNELATSYVYARQNHFTVLFRQIVASYAVQAVATAALLGVGGWLVVADQLTLGQLVAAELIVTGVLGSVAKLGKYLESYYDIVASLDKVGLVVDAPSERSDGAEREVREGPARLVVDRVGLSYGTKRVLEDVSFTVEPGERVAILGNDASGKSSLVDLLFGLRNAESGSIELDGVDLRTLSLESIREDVALVSEPSVFDGTIAENLDLGGQKFSAERLVAALDRVDLSDEVAKLPQGTSSPVGHKGTRLSSSQADRLTLARALLGSPRLLIVDETLDGLGPNSVAGVLRGLDELRSSMTVVVLTSQLEIAHAAGRVFVLENGTLHESRRSV